MKKLLFNFDENNKDPFEVEYELQKKGIFTNTSIKGNLALYNWLKNEFSVKSWSVNEIKLSLKVMNNYKKWIYKNKTSINKNKNVMMKKEIKRKDVRKWGGPSEKTIQNMMNYFDELSKLLTNTNGHLEPAENLTLQKKYKVSWNTLSIAKKLKFIESPKQKQFNILKTVNRARATKILKEKYGSFEIKYPIMSTTPYLLKGLYLKQGRRNDNETNLISKLSVILIYVFKLDKRYENSFKPLKNTSGLEKAILKYQKILDVQRKRRGIVDMSNEPTLFDSVNKQSTPVEIEIETSKPMGFYNGAEKKRAEKLPPSKPTGYYNSITEKREKQERIERNNFNSQLRKNLIGQRRSYYQSVLVKEIEELHYSMVKTIRQDKYALFSFSYTNCKNIHELKLTKDFLLKINELLDDCSTESYILKGFSKNISFIKNNNIIKIINTIKDLFGDLSHSIVVTKDADNPKRKAYLLVGSFAKELDKIKLQGLNDFFNDLNNTPFKKDSYVIDSWVIENEDTFSVSIYVDYEQLYDTNWEGCSQVIDPLNKQEPIVRDYVKDNINEVKKTLWIVQEKRNFKDLPNGPIEIGFNMEYVKWWTSKESAIQDANNMAKINPGKNYFVSMVTDVIATEVQTVQKKVDISIMLEDIDDENEEWLEEYQND
jgi:hypothetical protein